MTATVVATGFGGPEVLELREIPVGEPLPGEVLIEVKAAGTNPIDYKIYSGAFGTDPSSLPIRLGLEASGVVIEATPGAFGPQGPIRVGDEVIAYRAAGTYAGQVLVPQESIIQKPAALSYEEASGLLLAGCTAIHALKAVNVGIGDTVVIHGASGGVGLIAVQIAVLSGARVIATASKSRHEALRALGADPVAYGDGLMDRLMDLAGESIDAAVDCVGTEEVIDVSIALIPDKNRIVTMANAKRALESGVKTIGGAPGSDPGTDIRNAARLELVNLVNVGEIKIEIAASYSLEEVAAAHRALATGHTPGKIVLIP